MPLLPSLIGMFTLVSYMIKEVFLNPVVFRNALDKEISIHKLIYAKTWGHKYSKGPIIVKPNFIPQLIRRFSPVKLIRAVLEYHFDILVAIVQPHERKMRTIKVVLYLSNTLWGEPFDNSHMLHCCCCCCCFVVVIFVCLLFVVVVFF